MKEADSVVQTVWHNDVGLTVLRYRADIIIRDSSFDKEKVNVQFCQCLQMSDLYDMDSLFARDLVSVLRCRTDVIGTIVLARRRSVSSDVGLTY